MAQTKTRIKKVKNGDDSEERAGGSARRREGGFKEHKVAGKTSGFLHSPPPRHCPYGGVISGVVSVVYLRVTAEGCGDNGQALNDALQAPQVNPLHPGARDYAIAQRRQHYLHHRQQKQQWDSGEQTKGAEEERRGSRRVRESRRTRGKKRKGKK